MFIKGIEITNYKLFKNTFDISFNVPNGSTKGSGLTILCGENGNGKSSILEAIALAVQDYRSENFSIENLNDLESDVNISLNTTDFPVTTVLPSGKKFTANGFQFKANKRKRTTGELYGSLVVSGRKLLSDEVVDKDYELKCESPTPWGQPRYEQPSLLFLDKNRIYQTRKGSSTATNFDYLLERLCLDPQMVEDENPEYILPDTHPLKKAFEDFNDVFHIPLKLYKSNPMKQMENAFVASYTEKNIIRLNNLGSGYEMFFSILWAIYRSLNDKNDLIILLDEPELHLHPSMQQHLINLIITYSNKVQFVITTHSPLFIKQLYDVNPLWHVLCKEEGNPIKKNLNERKIKGFLSLNEVNFIAFGLYTEEYFNELYETLYRKAQNEDNTIRSSNFDEKFFVEQKHLNADKPYRADDNSKHVSCITFIRNIIHHKVDYQRAGLIVDFHNKLKYAIDTMRSYL